MREMRESASAFNQNIGSWDVSSVTDMHAMFEYVTLSTPNYSALLMGWSTRILQNSVFFDGANSKYGAGAAANARKDIIDIYNWLIQDGGKE